MRKSETRFIAKVNEILDQAEASGEAQRLFEKWFGAQTPYKLQRSFKIGPIAG